MSDTDERPTLAWALRSARGAESLRALAARVAISFQSLSRYERGELVPPRRFVEILDQALDQHGALLSHWSYDSWEPVGAPATRHQWAIPAAWRESVWALVVAVDGAVDEVLFRWGPWANRQVDLTAGRHAFGLQVNRDDAATDDRLLTCVTTSPTHVFWGTGQPVAALDARDLNVGWFPYEDGDLLRSAGRLLADALSHTGRTTAELADFLGVDVAVVDALTEGRPLSAQ